MDIIYFLRRRTAFARSFYEQAARPFAETQRKIERQEAPFDNPPLGEAAGPAYLAEWQEAEESLEMLGQMCLTFLSNSLKLYLYETTGKLSDILGVEFKRLLEGRQRGFPKYEHRFRQVGIDFRYAPVDLALIRQIVETQNLIQHAKSISLLHAHQSPAASKKFPRPFFAHPIDKAIAERQPDYTPTTLWVTPGALARAIEAVDAFCQWLDNELWATTRVGVVTKASRQNNVAIIRDWCYPRIQYWRGRPLVSLEVVVNLIGHTTTRSGLAIRSELDANNYPTGQPVTAQQMESISLKRDKFHGDWNYSLAPK